MNVRADDRLIEAGTAPGCRAEHATLRRFAWLTAWIMWSILIAFFVSVIIRVNLPDYAGASLQLDFTPFWGAARLALAGDALAAFDPARINDAMALPADQASSGFFWLYPPAWHLLIMPFGLLPFSAAYILYDVIAFLAFYWAIRSTAAHLPAGIPLMLGGPAVVLVLFYGNISLLWAACLAAALSAMANGRSALAGCLIALLTLKPQLGLLIPIALVFSGNWRTILWASGMSMAIIVISTAAVGVNYWIHWIEAMESMARLMEVDSIAFSMMITWYAFCRFLGAEHEIAMLVQVIAMVGAAFAVAWVWKRPVTSDLKAAALCASIPLATPYAWHSEFAVALVGAMFLAHDGFGRNTAQRIWLGILWLGQVPGLAFEPALPPVLYLPPVLTATVCFCIWRAMATETVSPTSHSLVRKWTLN